MIKIPELRTERLVLRRLNEFDIQPLYYLRNDECVNKFLSRTPPVNPSEVETFISGINQSIDEGKLFYWAITLKDDSKLIGTTCLMNFSEDNSEGEVGYELSPVFQGEGIMDEALKSVLKFGFEEVGLKIIHAYTHRNNRSSISLLTKNGFEVNDNKVDENNPDHVIFSKYHNN